MNEKLDMIYEGKAKRLFTTADSNKLIQEFKDSLTAFNAQKKGSFEGKGKINLKITTHLFDFLKKNGVKSHFVKTLSDSEMLVEKLEMIPLEVVVRNTAAGSISNRLGIPEGQVFSNPIVEFYYKKDELADPLINDEHALLLKAATKEELLELKHQALKINHLLLKFFHQVGINLVDFKIEFGRSHSGEILLADEISPDSCRLWDVKTNEKLDKDRFRRDLGRVEESYKILSQKIEESWSKF